MSDWNDRKFLIQIWLPGQGCSNFRSPAMTDSEAHEIIATLGGKSAPGEHHASGPTTSMLPSKVRGQHGLCWFEHRPDPNNPGRNYREIRCLLMDRREPAGQDLARLLEKLPVPATLDEARESGWTPIGAPSRIPVSGGKSGSGRRWGTMTWGVVVIGGLAVAVLVGLWLLYSPTPLPPGGAEGGASISPEPNQWSPAEWDSRRTDVKEILRWGEYNPDTMSDRQMLLAFLEVFKRPNIENVLTKQNTRNDYRLFRENHYPREPHPFLAFFDRFPEAEKISSLVPDGERDDSERSPAELASQVIPKLANCLNADLKEAARIRTSQGSKAMLEDLEDFVDYNAFYDEWLKQHDSFELPDDTDLLFRWQPAVRELLENKYNKD